MSRVIFFNVPAHGHINPTLGLTKELIRRGEDVVYYASQTFSQIIAATGASSRGYERFFHYDYKKMRHPWVLSAYLSHLSLELLDGNLLEDAQSLQPDYIIHDQLCIWGKYIAQRLNIPAICSIATFAFVNRVIVDYCLFQGLSFLSGLRDFQFMEFLWTWKQLYRNYGIKPERVLNQLSNVEELNLVYTSRYFQPYGKRLDNRFIFVGPSIEARNGNTDTDYTIEKQEGTKLIYISLGTLFNESPSFYDMCFKALGNTEFQILLSTGDRLPISTFKTIPDNFTVRRFVPQLEVLKQTDVFVSHGGMNSVHESLMFGVPLVIIPQGGDAPLVASRVRELGAGRVIRHKELSVPTLKDAIHAVLSDDKYRVNGTRIGASLKGAGGFRKAVEEILVFKARHNIS